MTAFYEIDRSRGYEYRYSENGSFTGWRYAGRATSKTLNRIEAVLVDCEYEIREICDVAGADGVFCGQLIFPARIRHALPSESLK